MNPFMDGHHMFSIYGTLIIVIKHITHISSHIKKNNMLSDRDWA